MVRIKSIKDFKRGDKITYRFPRSGENKVITGTVTRKSKTSVELRIDGQLVLTLSDKHLQNIEQIERVITHAFSLN